MKEAENIGNARGVTSRREALLKRLSIHTAGDLLLHLPLRFLDRRTFTPVSDLRNGSEAVIQGKIVSVFRRRKGRGPRITAILSDGTGSITLSFFNTGFPGSTLREGMDVTACGKVQLFRGFTIAHPELHFSPGTGDAPGMLPVYPLCAGLTQNFMRKLVREVLESADGELDEILSEDILVLEGFQNRLQVFKSAHEPESPEEAARAVRVLALEELYLYRSILDSVRRKGTASAGIRISGFTPEVYQDFLPWQMTSAQLKVCAEVAADLNSGSPVRRLVQGDVGSGKTVIAAYASAVTALEGFTSAILAPTEVLAHQHFKSMKDFLKPFDITVHLLTGGTVSSARKNIAVSMTDNPGCVLVGTHAVLEDWVPLKKLALMVVDEQHRFGVVQREKLLAGRNPRPHALIMSATPIPRTLAMTIYGDLDISVLDEMPPGRGSTETAVIGQSEKSRVFRFMLKRLEAGERAYLVYPLKEASENIDLRDAAGAYEVLCQGPAARFGIGLLHGSMTPEEKVRVTGEFTSGKISVLVSTTVIEVGIDVPEATVMIIVNAERFGLSQLHQLRGRIGRGGRDSWCFLVPGSEASSEALERLHILASTSDGFEVASRDLKLRGPGEVLGTAQHGIPSFRVADPSRDRDILHMVSSMKTIDSGKLNSLMVSQAWRYSGMSLPV